MGDPKQRVVLYHAGCRDGFGAAWAAHCHFGDTADYIPVTHHRPLPDFMFDSELWFVDFCPNAQPLVELLDDGHQIYVLDHHLSTKEVIETVQSRNLTFVFDLEHSGAVIAWEYFFPNRKVPPLLRFIEDHDLWKWALDDTEAVTEALAALDWTFKLFDQLNEHPERVEQLARSGHLMVAYKHKQVVRIVKRARFIDVGGHVVPVVNSDSYLSNVASSLAKANPQCAFGAAWFELQDGRRKWSLRSIGDFNVAEVAKIWGGGGHRNAAGFVR